MKYAQITKFEELANETDKKMRHINLLQSNNYWNAKEPRSTSKKKCWKWYLIKCGKNGKLLNIVIYVYKKGGAEICDNYSGIIVLSVLIKVYEGMVDCRILSYN